MASGGVGRRAELCCDVQAAASVQGRQNEGDVSVPGAVPHTCPADCPAAPTARLHCRLHASEVPTLQPQALLPNRARPPVCRARSDPWGRLRRACGFRRAAGVQPLQGALQADGHRQGALLPPGPPAQALVQDEQAAAHAPQERGPAQHVCDHHEEAGLQDDHLLARAPGLGWLLNAAASARTPGRPGPALGHRVAHMHAFRASPVCKHAKSKHAVPTVPSMPATAPCSGAAAHPAAAPPCMARP